MALRTYRVIVEQSVMVTLDDEKFDEAFMQEFRDGFFAFDDLRQHAEHIGQLYARGIWEDMVGHQFIEGYGPPDEMGIKAREDSFDVQAFEVTADA